MMNSCVKSFAIADDHWHMRQAIKQTLVSFGYNLIIEAEDGRKLIDQITSSSIPDICLLDMNMPFLNGVQTTRILKEKWPSIKIIIFSMSDRDLAKAEARAAGADAYLLKFDHIEKLRETLKDLEK